jgi:hypothetical protein
MPLPLIDVNAAISATKDEQIKRKILKVVSEIEQLILNNNSARSKFTQKEDLTKGGQFSFYVIYRYIHFSNSNQHQIVVSNSTCQIINICDSFLINDMNMNMNMILEFLTTRRNRQIDCQNQSCGEADIRTTKLYSRSGKL